MSSVENLLTFYSSRLSDKVMKLSQALQDCFHLDGFFYSHNDLEGNFYQISNQPALSETYFSNHFYRSNPFICHTDHYKNDNKIISTDFPYQTFVNDQNVIKMKHGISNFLIVYKKNLSGTHVFMYTSSEEKIPLNTIFLENQYALDKYSEYFLKEWASNQAAMKKYMIPVKELMGKSYEALEKGFREIFSKRMNNLKFMKKLGIIEYLDEDFTKRELDCIHHFLQGKSANEIAEVLGLSSRTVEHYLNNIKLKTNTYKKSELFQILQNYKMFNLL